MDILCLMGLFPENYRQEIEKNTIIGMQNAADKLQWALVKGLSSIDDVHVSIVNSVYIGSYPKRYRKLIIPSFSFTALDRINGENIGFCNLAGYKHFSRYRTAKKTVEAWAKQPSNEQKVLLIYALTRPFTKIAGFIKKRYGHIKVCIVVPDLPEYMRNNKTLVGPLYRITKNWSIQHIHQDIRMVDCYVLLTDSMKEWFDGTVKYTVVEGISGAVPELPEITKREKKIIYAGGINEAYGVVDLVKSFIRIGLPDWELVLYGDGSSKQMIQQLAKEHQNVKLMGQTPNQDVVKAQCMASILINPRKNQPFTKFSFPSKMLEYMASGTCVLAYKLDGIPAEYDQYYYHIPEEDNGMEKALRTVMCLQEDERQQMGERARSFVVQNKNPTVQCEKIVELLLN